MKAIFSVKAQCEAEDVSEGIRRNKPKNEVPFIAYYHKYFAIFKTSNTVGTFQVYEI